MADVRITRLAEVLVKYSLNVTKGDYLAIDAATTTLALIKEAYRLAVREGAFVELIARLPDLNWIFMNEASDEQLAMPSRFRKLAMEDFGKYLTIMNGFNTREMTNISAEKLKKVSLGTKDIRQKFFDRMAKGEVKWCGTAFPIEASAQEANMSLEEYENFVYGACLCDQPDPVLRWKEISANQAKIATYLNEANKISIKADGTDISFDTSGRKWINCDGHVNFPDGEVFTGPIETSANGHIRFSFPGIYMGKEIEDIRLEFREGKVVDARAAKGQDLLEQLLQTDEGARYIGELAIGTNYGIKSFTRNMLFDEKIGGTVHVAIGAGFEETGSKNKSAIHWDMLCDLRKGGYILMDGKKIYEDGKFIVKF
jgi:aminopeptidase